MRRVRSSLISRRVFHSCRRSRGSESPRWKLIICVTPGTSKCGRYPRVCQPRNPSAAPWDLAGGATFVSEQSTSLYRRSCKKASVRTTCEKGKEWERGRLFRELHGRALRADEASALL